MLGGALEISVAFASYNQGLAMVQYLREWKSEECKQERGAAPEEGSGASSGGKRVIPIGSTVAAGGISGAAIATVLTPIECIKCRLQVLNTIPVEQRPYHGVRGCIVKTFQKDGVRGFYTGFVSCVAREVPGNAVWFGTYNAVLRFLQRSSPPSSTPSFPADESPLDVDVVAQTAGWKVMLAGSLAGVGYWSAFFPADVVKTRMQTSERYAKLGFIGSLNAIGRESGVRGLYRGWGITILRAIPANAIIFFAYEKTSEILRDRFGL
jgi:solute carrier family 25 carnitine/acylcarnitine transporter 20/29